MVEVQWPKLAWIVRHDVSVVDDAVLLSKENVGVRSVFVITNTRLPKVDHGGVNAIIYQLHCGKLSKSATQTVTCGLYFVGWEKSLKPPNFSQNIGINRLSGIVETFVDLTVAIWTSLVLDFVEVEVGDEVRQREGTSEYYIDRTVGWQIANETFSVVQKVVKSLCCDKTCGRAAISVLQVVAVAAVGILTEFERDARLLVSVSGQGCSDQHARCE